MEGIAAWWTTQPRWWAAFWNAVDDLDSPVRMVHESVVSAAECDAVIEAGGATVSPVGDMVNFAPAGGC